MTSRTILLQLDVDDQPSTFDAVVAFDAGADVLLRHGGVTPENVTGLVHGAMFTRGGESLKRTAIFVGGGDVAAAEAVYKRVRETFFGPVRVSVMLDAAGCNTTAAAAVASAARHLNLTSTRAVVLGGTGPVGRRVAQMLSKVGANVVLTSRRLERAQSACQAIADRGGPGSLEPAAPEGPEALKKLLSNADVLFACGAAGVELVDESTLKSLTQLRVAIDLNAVPPAGLGGVEAFDQAKLLGNGETVPQVDGSQVDGSQVDGSQVDGPLVYGPIGVGGLKMKTHRAAVARLFESNEATLDADEIFEMTQTIEAAATSDT